MTLPGRRAGGHDGAALTTVVADLATRMPRPPKPPTTTEQPPRRAPDDAPLSQALLWDTVTSYLRPGDVTCVGQPLWASIGYTVPALLGACTARPGRRGVLLVGDGGAQMTVQELATVLREQLPAVVVVVDDDGYTVERAIHGPDEPYNDISRWDWTRAPALFGGPDVPVTRATTAGELRAALGAAQARPDRFSLVQAVVPRDDVPELLASLVRVLAATNARKDA